MPFRDTWSHDAAYRAKLVTVLGVPDLPSLGIPPERRPGSYEELRRNLGRSILLGMEVLIVADIVRTIIVDPTYQSAVVLDVIILVRILLSFAVEVEMDGMWPWNRWRRQAPNPLASSRRLGSPR